MQLRSTHRKVKSIPGVLVQSGQKREEEDRTEWAYIGANLDFGISHQPQEYRKVPESTVININILMGKVHK